MTQDHQGEDTQIDATTSELMSTDESESAGVELRVKQVPAATAGLVSVDPNDRIEVACSKMSLHNYSQLAVLAGPRSLKGFISWETIGIKRLVAEPRHVREAMDPRPEVVQLDDPLLPELPTVADANFVFVQAQDRSLTGIITAADITEEFRSLAGPYLILGEIERHLRRLIERVCSIEEICEAKHPADGQRTVERVQDLSLGELARLVERQDVWERFGWQLDRVTVVHQLQHLLTIRNALMHFAEQPLSDDDRWTLESFSRLLGRLT